jgi:hypothetical protein
MVTETLVRTANRSRTGPLTGAATVIGDIGGHGQGGGYPWASYSDSYSRSTLRLFLIAQAEQA